MLAPLAGALLLEPVDNGRPRVAAIAPELDAWQAAGAGFLADPTNRHGQALCDLTSIEKALGHVTSFTARTWQH